MRPSAKRRKPVSPYSDQLRQAAARCSNDLASLLQPVNPASKVSALPVWFQPCSAAPPSVTATTLRSAPPRTG